MNIGVDIRCLMNKERTGVGEYTYELLNALFSYDKADSKKDDADENQYFLFYNSWTDVSVHIPKWKQENVHYVYTRWPNKALNLLVWLRIVRLDKFPPLVGEGRVGLDVWFSPNLNFTNLSKQVKHILTIHDLSFEFFSECFTLKQRWWHKFLNPKRQCQRADVILTPSENTKRDVVESYKVESRKLKVLNPGLSSVFRLRQSDFRQKIREKYNLPEKFILFLGTLEPRKNIESLIQAYQLSAVSYELVIAGSSGWKNKKILKLISQTPGVQYIGYVDEVDKPALYQSASLFIYPSLYEGFGLPVLEAMASGVPVITSNRSSLPEVADDVAYLVNPHNVSEIANGMRLILSDEKLRNMMVEKGKIRAEKFKWGKTAEEFVKILNI